jgi:hypothetical protein
MIAFIESFEGFNVFRLGVKYYYNNFTAISYSYWLAQITPEILKM